MPREPAAVRVYTVCDESKYLIVRNVPSLGCGDELANLFATYGPVDQSVASHRSSPILLLLLPRYTMLLIHTNSCLYEWLDFPLLPANSAGALPWMPRTVSPTPMFSSSSSHRFAKRKLDESVFLGNRLQVSYAPQFESLLDTKDKLEVRRKEVLGRMKSSSGRPDGLSHHSPGQESSAGNSHHQISSNKREYTKTLHASQIEDPRFSHVSSNKDYFPSKAMNATVKLVREKLDKIQSSSDNSNAVVTSKKPRTDNRRRI